MKAKLTLLCLLTVLCGKAFAQDVIHTLDGRAIEAKVLEISDSDVRYKTFDNLDGPDYRMSTSLIGRIVFQNGTEQLFASAPILVPGPYAYDPYGVYGPVEFRRGYFYDRRGRLSPGQVQDYLGVSLYGSDYRKAVRQYTWGYWLTASGIALLAAAITGSVLQADINRSFSSLSRDGSSYHSAMEGLYIGWGIAGAACLGTGIPLWVKGNRKLDAIADDYNRRYGGNAYSQPISLNVGSTASGFGLTLNF